MTMIASVTLNGEALVRQSMSARAQFDRLIRIALERTVELAVSYARLSTLYVSRSGTLRQSIHGLVSLGFGGVAGTGGGPFGRVEATSPYASFVHNGTAPHLILPRRKTWLRFEAGGAIRFSKGVFHPGTEPRPFLDEAAQRVSPTFERLVTEAFTKAFS